MIRYGAYAARQSIPLDAPVVQPRPVLKIVEPPVVPPNPDVLSSRQIIRLVAEATTVPYEDILGMSQDRFTTRARQIAMYIAKQYLRCSYARIGRAFIRDHSTVIHAVRIVAHRVKTEPETAYMVANVMKAMPAREYP